MTERPRRRASDRQESFEQQPEFAPVSRERVPEDADHTPQLIERRQRSLDWAGDERRSRR